LDAGGERFASYIIDHGLGPLWHSRTGREEFHANRLSAEALYLAQERALREVDELLNAAGIEYAIIKGAANRVVLQENPALRVCYDIDMLVREEDRIRAVSALVETGFTAAPNANSISRELILSRGVVDIDLHWALLREGRLRGDCTAAMLGRRRRLDNIWTVNAEDALFVLLVHPAFAKHLDGWAMGLHRVADIVTWLRTQSFDWQQVLARLEQEGVQTAAWAALRWVDLIAHPHSIPALSDMLADLRPGRLRAAWLDWWLRSDLSARSSGAHWVRLLAFSMFLHDKPRDALRAFVGRQRARRRSSADLGAFQNLIG
jgi:hypothetical protein